MSVEILSNGSSHLILMSLYLENPLAARLTRRTPSCLVVWRQENESDQAFKEYPFRLQLFPHGFVSLDGRARPLALVMQKEEGEKLVEMLPSMVDENDRFSKKEKKILGRGSWACEIVRWTKNVDFLEEIDFLEEMRQPCLWNAEEFRVADVDWDDVLSEF